MTNINVLKRDGQTVVFEEDKILQAIRKAMQGASGKIEEEKAAAFLQKTLKQISNKKTGLISVEDIQDIVEDVLIKSSEKTVAKHYIAYRAQRTQVRESNMKLMLDIKNITFKDSLDVDQKRENANIDANTSMGMMLQYGAHASRQFACMHVLNPIYAKAHSSGDIHIHDLDFEAIGTTTCTQIDLLRLFRGGFSTGHGHLREPQDVMSYAALAAIAIQSNQNDQHGGQSVPNFDYSLAPGVAKTFAKAYKNNLIKLLQAELSGNLTLNDGPDSEKYDQLRTSIDKLVGKYSEEGNDFPRIGLKNFCSYVEEERPRLLKALSISEELLTKFQTLAYRYAKEETEKRTYQAMEGFLHNLNTMHSRAGAQVPFSSVNLGTDQTDEGRLITRQFLLATEAGLGNGETAIFPISIFKVKEGVNFNPGEPNYDLFKLAIRVTAKRLFPNFVFIDAPYNLKYYVKGRPETEACAMGCRTRVMGSVFPETDGIAFGRGNNSFTTINLPRLGIMHGIALGQRDVPDWEGFYRDLDEKTEIIVGQLLERYEIQKNKKVKNFPFLMGQKVWLGTEQLGPEDKLEAALKHGTFSMGFIGLAEALKAMTGEHQGESEKTQKLGLEIVSHMRRRMDEASRKYHLNFTLLATPAEGLSGRFVAIDTKKYGVIPGVTDNKFYTNSFHVPVYFPIGIMGKLRKEAPYHELTNAGHITYVELDGDTAKNTDAVEKIVRAMKELNIGYGSINHPVDRDPVCGFNGIINDKCPVCGRDESTGPKFERIRRITGYLVGTLDRWNDAKQDEESKRVKHH